MPVKIDKESARIYVNDEGEILYGVNVREIVGNMVTVHRCITLDVLDMVVTDLVCSTEEFGEFVASTTSSVINGQFMGEKAHELPVRGQFVEVKSKNNYDYFTFRELRVI